MVFTILVPLKKILSINVLFLITTHIKKGKKKQQKKALPPTPNRQFMSVDLTLWFHRIIKQQCEKAWRIFNPLANAYMLNAMYRFNVYV